MLNDDLQLVNYYCRSLAAHGVTADIALSPKGVELRMPAGSTEEQTVAAQALLDAIVAAAPVEAARAARLADLDAWYVVACAQGITVNGITLAADLASQGRYGDDMTVAIGGVVLGYGSVEWEVIDAFRARHKMTAQEAATLYFFAAAGVKALSVKYAECAEAILAAATVEAVQEVPLPT